VARKPRLHIEGGFYHVILRGNGGEKIFFSRKDRSRLSLLIQEGIKRFRYRLHAYCFMTNHVHLVVQVGSVPLSKIMQNLSFRYTRYINKKKNRTGHLFQGRYKAILVDADNYMVELIRYIHNNPVRAGMVNRAVEYQWSSHQAYLGLYELSFLTTDWVLAQFGNTKPQARGKFADFVERGNKEKRREEYYKGEQDSRILGDDRFAEEVLMGKPQKKNLPLDAVVTYVCRQSQVTEEELSSPSRKRKNSEIRGIIGWLTTRLSAATLSEVGKRFNRDLATISRGANNIEKRIFESEQLKERLDKILKEIGH